MGVLKKDELSRQRELFGWSDGNRSQIWRLRRKEVVICQCHILGQRICP